MPNRYTIRVKVVSLEILFTSTKPYYIPFNYMPPRCQRIARNYKKSLIFLALRYRETTLPYPAIIVCIEGIRTPAGIEPVTFGVYIRKVQGGVGETR